MLGLPRRVEIRPPQGRDRAGNTKRTSPNLWRKNKEMGGGYECLYRLMNNNYYQKGKLQQL